MRKFIIKIENSTGTLEKVTNVFTRNHVNISLLTVKATTDNEQGRIEASAEVGDETAARVMLQLKRIIEVSEVQLNP